MRTTQYFPFAGGINTTAPALSVPSGELIDALNYEPNPMGGYRAIGGFEAFDGHPAPSDLSVFDYDTDALWIAAMTARRDLIDEVPGEGSVLGVWRFDGTTYAFRNKTGGASAGMYESTATGWSEVTTGITLSPSGRYEFVNYNFGGHAGSTKMYGVDGTNKAFEYDGTTYTEITTGMTSDKPTHVFAKDNYLWLSFVGGSVQHSPLKDPTGTWTLSLGTGEIAVGDEVTGFKDMPSGTMGIFCRNSINILSGFVGVDLAMKLYSAEVGAVEHSIQRVGNPAFATDYGISTLLPVMEYGDFKSINITEKAEDVFKVLQGKLVSSVVVRDKEQMRLFYSNGLGIILGFRKSKLIGIMPFNYGVVAACSSSAKDTDGTEHVYMGSDDGYVYQLDAGNSFNGEARTSWLIPVFNQFKTPERVKRFFKVVLEIDAKAATTMSFRPVFNYGDVDDPDARSQILSFDDTIEISGGGGVWDSSTWGEFYYDSDLVGSAYGYITGVGQNMSLAIESTSTNEEPHTIQGAIVHYSNRGIQR